MSFVGSNILAGASGQGGGGYAIERSLRFNLGDSPYLSKNFASAGNRTAWTWSGWVKRSKMPNDREVLFGGYGASNDTDWIEFGYENSQFYYTTSSVTGTSTEVFRDPSAWQHVVVNYNGSNVKFYSNGTEVWSVSKSGNLGINGAWTHRIGRSPSSVTRYFDGYLADVHFIDGQALAPTDFGETDDNGVWQPKKFTGQYNVSQSGGSSSAPTSTSDVAPSGSYGNGIASAALLFGASELTNGQNHIRQDNGGIEWSPAIALTGSDVAGAKCLYFNSASSSYAIEFKINGSWVTAQANAQNSIGTSSALITLATTGNWTGVRVTGGGNTHVTTVAGIFVNGTRLQSAYSFPAVNGFHLDFADNSSNAALGTDTSGNNNTWTVNNLTAASTKVATFNGTTNVSGSMTALGNQDWTVELFFEKTGSGTQEAFFGFPGNSPYFEYDGGQLRWMTSSTYGPTLAQNQRYHAAWVRYNNKGYIYLDGTLISPSSGITYTTNETDTAFAIGARQGGGTGLNGYMDNLRVVVGTALYTSNFTVPSTPLAAVTNCQLLALQTDLTTDSSGQNVSLTNNGAIFSDPNGPSVDSLVDSPSNAAEPSDTGAGGEVVGNYATYNPVRVGSGTKSDGNLTVTGTGQVPDVTSIAPNSGKWYAEIKWDSGSYARIGLQDVNIATSDFGGVNGQSYRYESNSGNVQPGGQTYSTYAAGDIIGVAFDCDAGKLWLAKNGTWLNSGDPAAGSGAVATNLVSGSHYAPANSSGSGSSVFTINCGQRAFAYTAPTNFKALNTANLPEPTIADGSKYFDTKVWTGDGSTTRAISGLEFSPDLCWTKARSIGFGHRLWDTVRGATKRLESHATTAEATEANGVKSFDSNGFTIGNDGNVNQNNYTFASWNWDAGSSNTTIAAGGLNSSVYNQSQVWSNNNNAVSNPANATDGNLSSYAQTSDPTSQIVLSSIGGLSGLVRVYVGTSGGTRYLISTNDGTTVTTATFWGGGWVTVGTASNITTITTTRIYSGNTNPTNDCRVYGYEIAGKLLIDSGVTPPNVPSTASTVRASASSGFSIVSYTGTGANATLGHGLNAAPKMIITKNISANASWAVYHSALGNGSLLQLEKTDAAINSASAWNSTDPTSSVFSVGNYADTNNQNEAYIAYCFSSVDQYSSVGSYTGNGSADGLFIYTGFTPSWLLFKRHDSTSDWTIYDTARDPHNVAGNKLEPNTSDAESAEGAVVDILSNGFKFRRGSLENGGNDQYIYMAFASNPFKTARAR